MAMSLDTQRALADALGQAAANEIITAFNSVASLESLGGVNVDNPEESPADADVLRDDLVTNVLPDIVTRLTDLSNSINAIRTGFGGS